MPTGHSGAPRPRGDRGAGLGRAACGAAGAAALAPGRGTELLLLVGCRRRCGAAGSAVSRSGLSCFTPARRLGLSCSSATPSGCSWCPCPLRAWRWDTFGCGWDARLPRR